MVPQKTQTQTLHWCWNTVGCGACNFGILAWLVSKVTRCQYTPVVQLIWSNYSDLTRPHPKWWFSKGNPLISGKSRLVKYYNLARLILLMVQKSGRPPDMYETLQIIWHLPYQLVSRVSSINSMFRFMTYWSLQFLANSLTFESKMSFFYLLKVWMTLWPLRISMTS